MNIRQIAFRPLQETDLPLLHRWLNTPHASQWWKIYGHYCPSPDEVRKKYLPRINGQEPVNCYVISYNNKPIGMVQSCLLDDYPAEKANFSLNQSCAGIDICIGEEDYVHRGLGSVIIRKFLTDIIFQKYKVDCCIVDPSVRNEIAIKAYNKAGFKYLKTVWYEKEGEQEHILIINRDEIGTDKSKESKLKKEIHIKAEYQPIEWRGDRVIILDQTRLPREEVYLEFDDYRDVAAAIKELKVRGAPAIGLAGAYAVLLGALKIDAAARGEFLEKLQGVIDAIGTTRPTARNLFFALERMKKASETGKSSKDIKKALVDEAVKIHEEEAEATRRLSRFGSELIKDGWTVLTHCNTGPLATSGSGTALGAIIAAHKQGKKIQVLVDETRPLLQGARLTTWELKKAGVPVTLITDSMAGSFMKRGKVDCVITGADRIAANGDTANKIGTYTLAVLAKENKVPFYIAAPTSTIDRSLKTGDSIPIEERKAEEVTHLNGVPIAPEGVSAANPAFDVTPHKYITAIITEKGIIRAPYVAGIKGIV